MPNPQTYGNCLLVVFYVILLILNIGCNQDKSIVSEATSPNIDSVQIVLNKSNSLEKGDPKKSQLLHIASQKVRKIPNDTLKCKYFTEISLQLTYTNDTTQFRTLNREALRLAERIKDSSSISYLHWDLGDYFKKTAVSDSAFYHFNKAEKIFTAIGDNASSGIVLCSMAWAQNSIGDYTGSDITAIRAVEKLKPLARFDELSRCYSLLGDNAKLLNEYDRSLEYYNESLNYLRMAEENPLNELGIKNGFGLVYQKKGEHEKAITYFSEVLRFDSLRFKKPMLYSRALNNLGYSYLKTNKIDKLPGPFTQAIAIQDSIDDLGGKTSSSHKLAEYFLVKKDTANAIIHLQVAKTYALQNNNNKRLLEILRLFPRVDPVNSSSYTQEYLALNDSLLIQERQIRDKFARIQFETNEISAENQLLARQKQLWTGIAASLLLLGLSTFVIVSQRVKNQKLLFKEQQQASNQEIFNLLLAQKEKVEEGKKLEQKRVSEELHDGVLGRMLGTRMMLLGLNKKTDEASIAERAKAIAILQEVESEVRSISHELSHAAYQKIHNFILSITDLVQSVESSSKIDINFNYADDLDYDALTGEIKINLYRILQESIQNAVKHADCTHINLSFGADSEALRVVVSDDGKGYFVKKGKKGIGTRNIASRIQKVNGTWDIDSTVGKGTTVTLIIPIVANDNSSNIKMIQEELQEF
mgnify:CR=1 FL=1